MFILFKINDKIKLYYMVIKRGLCMNNDVNYFFNKINNVSLDMVDYDYVYSELICCCAKGIDNSNNMDILRIFSDLIDLDKKYIKMKDDYILITNDFRKKHFNRRVRLGIFNKIDNVIFNIDSLISFCNKKKIIFNGVLRKINMVLYLELEINNIDDSLLLINYINSKLVNNLYDVGSLFFSIDKVIISLDGEYSYVEILSKYLVDFIFKMKCIGDIVNYDNFKKYMLENYYKIDNEIEMDSFLRFNFKDIELSKFFRCLEQSTEIILYLFNGNNFDKFKSYFNKINKINYNKKYMIYDNFDGCRDIFIQLVTSMYLNYGEDYTKNNILKYRDTGMGDYITRKDDLRKKVISSKNFKIYLMSLSLDKEIDLVINKIKYEKKKIILEEVCKEIFFKYLDSNSINFSKLQVARSLIRMSYGDYSTITRFNDARKKAIDNIESNEVLDLIKMVLGIEKVLIEEELYELYADYIENLCIN